MSAQTIAQVPYDLTDPTTLKRFLTTLVGNLDTVLGYKGTDSKYISDKEFQSAGSSIQELDKQVSTAQDSLTKVQEAQEEQGNTLQEQSETVGSLGTFLKTKLLDAPYRDFNAIAWGSLQGRFELTALGSEFSNAPTALTAGTTYTVYIDSTKTNAAVWQYVLIDGSGSRDIYTRVSVSNDWTKLN